MLKKKRTSLHIWTMRSTNTKWWSVIRWTDSGLSIVTPIFLMFTTPTAAWPGTNATNCWPYPYPMWKTLNRTMRPPYTFSESNATARMKNHPAYLRTIFYTKAVNEGTGIVLAVVQGIVRGHGGSILVHSEPGKDTTFQLFFPIIDSPDKQYSESETVGSNLSELPRGMNIFCWLMMSLRYYGWRGTGWKTRVTWL